MSLVPFPDQAGLGNRCQPALICLSCVANQPLVSSKAGHVGSNDFRCSSRYKSRSLEPMDQKKQGLSNGFQVFFYLHSEDLSISTTAGGALLGAQTGYGTARRGAVGQLWSSGQGICSLQRPGASKFSICHKPRKRILSTTFAGNACFY